MQENAGLYRRGLMSKEEYSASQSKYAVAQASYDQLQTALEIAQSQIDLTIIRSPIDGVVVAKNVNVGQTVSATTQTPALFLIADDLTKMQLDTNVSEADIGKIQHEQTAFFALMPTRVALSRAASGRSEMYQRPCKTWSCMT